MKESKKPNYEGRLAAMREATLAQRREIEDGKLLGVSTKDIARLATHEFGEAPYFPRAEHPRMMVTKETLVRVRRALREKTPSVFASRSMPPV